MSARIDIRFDCELPVYQPGTEVTGRVTIQDAAPLPVKRVEFSVLWHTSGKGDEDLEIIAFETRYAQSTLRGAVEFPFRAKLPASPLSYDGTLLKIHWAARVRIFPQHGADFGVEAEFQVVDAPVTPA